MTRKQLKKERTLEKISSDHRITHCYIIKEGIGFYKKNASGYVDWYYQASIFTKEEALKHAKTCTELRLIPITISAHNKKVLEEVAVVMENYIYH